MDRSLFGGRTLRPLRIGVVGALSGARTAFTNQLRMGALLAGQAWESEGGHPTEFVWGDDQASVECVDAVAADLVEQGVAGVVGHFSSGCALKAAPIYAQVDLPLLLPAATHPDLTHLGYRNIFRLCGTDATMAATIGEQIRMLPVGNVVVVDDGSPYGRSVAQFVSDYLLDRQTTITGRFTWSMALQSETKDEILQQLIALRPEVVMFSGGNLPAAELTTKLRTQRPDLALMFGDDVLIQEYLDITGNHAEGVWIVGPPGLPRNREVDEVRSQFCSATGEELGFYALTTYAAVTILLRALQESLGERNITLSEMIRGRTWETILGEVQFDAKGDAVANPWGIWRVQKGDFVPIQ